MCACVLKYAYLLACYSIVDDVMLMNAMMNVMAIEHVITYATPYLHSRITFLKSLNIFLSM